MKPSSAVQTVRDSHIVPHGWRTLPLRLLTETFSLTPKHLGKEQTNTQVPVCHCNKLWTCDASGDGNQSLRRITLFSVCCASGLMVVFTTFTAILRKINDSLLLLLACRTQTGSQWFNVAVIYFKVAHASASDTQKVQRDALKNGCIPFSPGDPIYPTSVALQLMYRHLELWPPHWRVTLNLTHQPGAPEQLHHGSRRRQFSSLCRLTIWRRADKGGRAWRKQRVWTDVLF